MMHHHDHTKFGYKRFSSWGDIVQINIHWDFEPFLWPSPFTRQSSLWWCALKSSLVAKDQLFRRYNRNCHILIIWAFAVTSTLKTAHKSFCMTLRLMMMHHNTKFGKNLFGGLKDIVWTNINNSTLHCDIDPKCSNPDGFFFTRRSGLWWYIIRLIWLPKNQLFGWCSRKSHILTIWALVVTLTLTIANNFCVCAWHYGSWCCITMPSLVTKCSVVQKISSNIHWHFELLLLPWNTILKQVTPTYDDVLSNQVWLQTDQQFRRYSRNNHINNLLII